MTAPPTTSERDMPPIVNTAQALACCHTALGHTDATIKAAGEAVMSFLAYGLRLETLILPEACADSWNLIKDLGE